MIDYLKYHKKRIDFAMKLIHEIDPVSVLEIGQGEITRQLCGSGPLVYTCGFDELLLNKVKHYEFDLSKLTAERPVIQRRFSVVVAAEVIEHILIPMPVMFAWLNSLCRIGSKVIIQTPNACCLKNRIAMLFGRNPFQKITATIHDHIREYTLKELTEYANAAGFRVKESYIKNYFDYSHSWKARLYNFICKFMPARFKDGITIVLSKV